MTAIYILEERAPYLLVEHAGGFAVVERRAGKLYPLVNGERRPDPLTDEGADHAVGPHGWFDEQTARATFEEVTVEYKQLSEHIR